MRITAACLGVALLAAACGATEPTVAPSDDAEVLGLQIERQADGIRTFEPTAEPAPSEAETATEARPTPPVDPAPSIEATPSVAPTSPEPAPTTPRPSPEPTRPVTPPAPTPTPTRSPSPAPTPEDLQLSSRDGHSFVTWFSQVTPLADGTTEMTWGAISAAPPITRDEPSEPLRVTLLDPTGPAGASVREARCHAFLEVDGTSALRARGDVRAWLMVDGEPAQDLSASVDVRLLPGERRDLLTLEGLEVDAARHDQVTCRVAFVAR